MRSAEQRHADHAAKTAALKAKRDERLEAIAARQAERTAARDAARDEREAAKAQAAAARAENPPAARFPALGVQIMTNGDLHTFNGIGGRGRLLGPAAGAVAEVGNERRRHRVGGAVASTAVLGPLGLLGAAGKKAKASAFVTLADGTFHERKLDGNTEVSRAHREVAAFRAAIIRLG